MKTVITTIAVLLLVAATGCQEGISISGMRAQDTDLKTRIGIPVADGVEVGPVLT